MKQRIAISIAVGVAGAAAGHAGAQALTTVRLTNGMSRPCFAASPPGDLSRLFVVEQRGSDGVQARAKVRILNLADNTVNAAPFLTIEPVATDVEQGLLGLAFDPDYAANGYCYVYYTASNMSTNLVRYHVSADPNVADPASATAVLIEPHPFTNHNGGWIAFGPDGYLYVAIGDGGPGCDPNAYAQNVGSPLGKILRLDVSSLPYTVPPTNPFVGQPGAREEIWAWGLRNPWRCAFDRATGELYIADVGQSLQEEINVQPPSAGGVNYGWSCREGLVCSSGAGSGCPTPAVCPGCVLPNAVDPVWVYDHFTGCSITGGYVYRGSAIPGLRGTYFFADYCAARIWSFQYAGQPVASVADRTAELATAGLSINGIASFAEDARGELYILDQAGGEVYKIVPRCPINCDASTAPPVLNINDFSCFLNQFAAGDPYANCDRSTAAPVMNILDFVCFLNRFAAGCS